MPVRQRPESGYRYAQPHPDTDTRNHSARVGWSRIISGATTVDGTVGFDRLGSLIRPEEDWPGPTVGFNNAITSIGPSPPIPLDRAQNGFKGGLSTSALRGEHRLSFGGEVTRLRVNSLEQDGNRGILNFTNDFGRDFITNLRLGRPSQLTVGRTFAYGERRVVLRAESVNLFNTPQFAEPT